MSKELGKEMLKRLDRDIGEQFALLLKKHRKKAGLSLSELSSLTGISASYLNRLEKYERRCPTLPMAIAISRALNVNIADLLGLQAIEQDEESTATLDHLLITKDYVVGEEKVLNKDEKEILADLIILIFEMDWEDSSKYKNLLRIGEMIDKLRDE